MSPPGWRRARDRHRAIGRRRCRIYRFPWWARFWVGGVCWGGLGVCRGGFGVGGGPPTSAKTFAACGAPAPRSSLLPPPPPARARSPCSRPGARSALGGNQGGGPDKNGKSPHKKRPMRLLYWRKSARPTSKRRPVPVRKGPVDVQGTVEVLSVGGRGILTMIEQSTGPSRDVQRNRATSTERIQRRRQEAIGPGGIAGRR